jgi:hypothetical protein
MRNVLKVQEQVTYSRKAYRKVNIIKPTIKIAPKWLEAIGAMPGQSVIFEIEGDEITGLRLVISAEEPF